MTQREYEIEIMNYIFIRQTVRLKRGRDRYTTTTTANSCTTNSITITGTGICTLSNSASQIPRRAEEDEVLVVGCYDALRVVLRLVEKLWWLRI